MIKFDYCGDEIQRDFDKHLSSHEGLQVYLTHLKLAYEDEPSPDHSDDEIDPPLGGRVITIYRVFYAAPGSDVFEVFELLAVMGARGFWRILEGPAWASKPMNSYRTLQVGPRKIGKSITSIQRHIAARHSADMLAPELVEYGPSFGPASPPSGSGSFAEPKGP